MKKDIYTYDCPLEFIKDRMGQITPSLTHREFAAKLGLKSPATLNHILKGRRRISAEYIPTISEALKLSGPELRFLEALIRYSQSATVAEREVNFHEMRRLRVKSTAFQVGLRKHEYFSRWYYAPILELLHFREFTLEDCSAIGRGLYPTLGANEVRKALDKLIELELVQLGPDGVLRRVPQTLSAEGIPLSHLRHRNRELLDLAKSAQDDFAREQRNISSVTMAVSPKNFEKISQKIDELRHWILSIEGEKDDMDRVIQVTVAAHPLTQLEVSSATVD